MGSCRFAHSSLPYSLAPNVGMCTLLTQTFCLMCNTQVLGLGENKIGDPGMIKLSESIGKGALPKCTSIYLFGNPGDEAPVQKALRERKV